MSHGQRIISGKPIPQDSVTYYATVSMDKPDPVAWGEGRDKYAWYRLKELLDSEFGSLPYTKKDVYDKVTSKLGLNYYETHELINNMRKSGLLEVTRIKG